MPEREKKKKIKLVLAFAATLNAKRRQMKRRMYMNIYIFPGGCGAGKIMLVFRQTIFPLLKAVSIC